MRILIIYPSRESEKAISGYSVNLVRALRKNKLYIDEMTYIAGSPFSLIKKIKEVKNYDLVHIQHEYNLLGWYGIPFFFIFLFIWLLKKGKLITTMHTAISQREKFRGNPIKNFLRRVLYTIQNRLINYVSDLIIVHAHFFVPILVNEYGIPLRKIRVFPQGIIENIKTIPKSKAKKGLKLSGPVYLIIGNLIPDHGADIILRQADKIEKTILIVSNPKSINDRNEERLAKHLNDLKELVRKNGFEKFVRFDIRPINDKMPLWWTYFSAADLVLQPYRGGIGSGIFTHAMAVKTPVMASNIPFFREISKKYGCIQLSEKEEDYSEVIKEAMKPKTYRKMVKEAERYSKENSWSKVSKKYKKLYNSI